MINRDSWGHSYLIVRGEILGFMKDEQLQKHLPRMFSLIKTGVHEVRLERHESHRFRDGRRIVRRGGGRGSFGPATVG